METSTPYDLGLQVRGAESREYDLDEEELYSGPSEWEQDRFNVFSWAKHSSWGQTRKIPLDLATENLRCSQCESPRKQAICVSYFRDLLCERHYQKWLRQLRKKPKSQKKLRQEALEEWLEREHHCSWHDVKNGMFWGDVNTREASFQASSETL